eukprot:scaffold3319_cov427-Prasinococcus_capsulatus_cf.AAC.5
MALKLHALGAAKLPLAKRTPSHSSQRRPQVVPVCKPWPARPGRNGSDARSRKLNRAPGGPQPCRGSSNGEQPWQFLEYHTKKRYRLTDSQGNLVKDEGTLQEPAAFANNPSGRLDLAIRAIAVERARLNDQDGNDIQVERIRHRVHALLAAVPGLADLTTAENAHLALREVGQRLSLGPKLISTQVCQCVRKGMLCSHRCRRVTLLD